MISPLTRNEFLTIAISQQGKQTTSKSQYEEKFLQKMNAKCQENDNSSCIMVKLLNYMNKMLTKPSFTIGKRITLLQTRSVWLVFFRFVPSQIA